MAMRLTAQREYRMAQIVRAIKAEESFNRQKYAAFSEAIETFMLTEDLQLLMDSKPLDS
jgi:hypothetical protein